MSRSISSIAFLLLFISSAIGTSRTILVTFRGDSPLLQYLVAMSGEMQRDITLKTSLATTLDRSEPAYAAYQWILRHQITGRCATTAALAARNKPNTTDTRSDRSRSKTEIAVRTAHRHNLLKKRLLSSALLFYRQSTTPKRWYLGTGSVLFFVQLVFFFKLASNKKNGASAEYTGQMLSGRLIRAQEEERRRIARELHDDVSQRLSLICFQLDIMRRSPPNSETRLVEELSELYDETSLLSSDIHDFSRELHPAALEKFGLSTTLRRHCSEFSKRRRISVSLQIKGDEPPMHMDTSLALFRVGQECMTNIAKHSRATSCDVALHYTPDRVTLAIEDRGSGFDLKKRKAGLGIESMRERLRFVGGTLHIDTEPFFGTKVYVEAPIERAMPNRKYYKFDVIDSSRTHFCKTQSCIQYIDFLKK